MAEKGLVNRGSGRDSRDSRGPLFLLGFESLCPARVVVFYTSLDTLQSLEFG